VQLAAGIMLVLGIGLGLVMQVLVIAVQNDVEYRDMGVATSGATMFRLIGGSLGTAVLGAIFAAGLASRLGATSAHGLNVQAILRLPAAERAVYASAFTESLSFVFLVAAVIASLAFALAWFIPERPLRATLHPTASELEMESVTEPEPDAQSPGASAAARASRPARR
jgi:hypothetical protein